MMKKEELQSLLVLSGFEALNIWELANKYWPLSYTELRNENPWWLVQTKFGMIEIGWRKRVISISWNSTNTQYRFEVTQDDVSKDKDWVHAWTYSKAVEYLTNLRKMMEEVYDRQ